MQAWVGWIDRSWQTPGVTLSVLARFLQLDDFLNAIYFTECTRWFSPFYMVPSPVIFMWHQSFFSSVILESTIETSNKLNNDSNIKEIAKGGSASYIYSPCFIIIIIICLLFLAGVGWAVFCKTTRCLSYHQPFWSPFIGCSIAILKLVLT